MSRRTLTPASFPWADVSRYTFSLGVAAGGTAYLSGQTGTPSDGGSGRAGWAGDDVAEQTRAAYHRLGVVLASADLTFDDVARVTEYVRADSLDRYDEVAGVRAEVFGDATPAVNTVVVHALLWEQARVEIEVTAAAGNEHRAFGSNGTVAQAPVHGLGDLVYVSTCLPLDDAGDVVAPDDLVGQTERIYEVAAARLAQVGLGLEHVVKTVEFVKPHVRRDYPRTGRVRKAHLAAPYGGATGIEMERLLHPDALMQVDFLASPLPREAYTCGWERYDRLTYSPGLRVGDLFVMSGQAALDPVTEKAVLAGDVVEQARYTYRNVLTVLEAAGLTAADLVQTVEYVCPDGMAEYAGVADVRRELLGPDFPAATGVGCSSLLRPEFLLEIDPTAVFPGGAA